MIHSVWFLKFPLWTYPLHPWIWSTLVGFWHPLPLPASKKFEKYETKVYAKCDKDFNLCTTVGTSRGRQDIEGGGNLGDITCHGFCSHFPPSSLLYKVYSFTAYRSNAHVHYFVPQYLLATPPPPSPLLKFWWRHSWTSNIGEHRGFPLIDPYLEGGKLHVLCCDVSLLRRLYIPTIEIKESSFLWFR